MSIKARGKCVFNAELARSYPFIKKAEGKSPSDVVCMTCGGSINIANSGRSSIDQHVKKDKHQKALVQKRTPTVTNYFAPVKDISTSAYEGVWAYHIIKSNHSFASVDCASKIFRTCFELKKFHCGRTKAQAIITNVLAPYAIGVVRNELAERNFVSVSTDASNRGNIKMMPVVVRYFIPTIGVRVRLIEFSSEKGETAVIISSLVKKTAEENGIVEKIVGFCADNCATNFGSRERGGFNNVFYILKQWKPAIFGVGCAAHIVHNTLKSACDRLPVDMECVVVKIDAHFYINTVRVEKLKSICEFIEGAEYSKLLGYAKTRFLALGPAIESILNIFEPLKEYFMSLKSCPTTIESFFNDPFAKLWLLFVKDQVIYEYKYIFLTSTN